MKTKIQACIIDDEKDGRDYISLLLQNEFPEIQIAFQAASVEDAYIYLTKNSPDILFLDIQLKDGNAFDLLSKFKEIQSEIIFITAFENFAIQAIKNGATDYLLRMHKRKKLLNIMRY
jgi:two-component system LytT family response regulator